MIIMKLSGQEVKVDVEEELKRFSFDKVTFTNEKMICVSPFRNESSPSFFVRLKPYGDYSEGVWHDSGGEGEYKSGGFIKLLAFLESITEEEAEQYLLEKYGENNYEIRLNMPKFQVDKPKTTIDEGLITPFQRPCDYLTNRGIDERVQIIMRTGYNEKTKSVILPWYDANNVLQNVKYRRTDNKIFYYQKGGKPIQQLIYGLNIIYQKRVKKAVVVESEIDALTLLSAGIPSIALGGSNFSEYKANLIKQSPIEHLIIATDNDPVGQNMRKLIAKRLQYTTTLSNAYVPSPHKDVNDVRDRETLKQMIRDAIPKKQTFFSHFKLS